MLDAVCALPLSADLFTQAIHPTEPIVSVGLFSGVVETFRLPQIGGDVHGKSKAAASQPVNGKGGTAAIRGASDNGCAQIETIWKTRRHKGSCRSLAFSPDGNILFSAGTDGILKAASTSTGQVISKLAIPPDSSTGAADTPTVVHALSPQTLLLGTDSSALHLYDIRSAPSSLPSTASTSASFSFSSKPQQTHYPHEDYVSSIAALPASDTSTSGYSKQWVTTGATTLAVTDLRRGVLSQSDDQEEELLSCAYVRGLGPSSSSSSSKRKRQSDATSASTAGDQVLVGSASGVLTLWEPGKWADQSGRVVVDRAPGEGESLEAITVLPTGIGEALRGPHAAVGISDGTVRFVRLGRGRTPAVVGQVSHDELEGVVGLGVDVEGRLISGGGQIVKVWREAVTAGDDDDNAQESDADDDDDDDDEDSGAADDNILSTQAPPGSKKRNGLQKKGQSQKDVDDSQSDDDDDDDDDDDGDKSEGRKRRKKRKRNNAIKGGGAATTKPVLHFKGID